MRCSHGGNERENLWTLGLQIVRKFIFDTCFITWVSLRVLWDWVLITFKTEFLLQFTGCRKVLGQMPASRNTIYSQTINYRCVFSCPIFSCARPSFYYHLPVGEKCLDKCLLLENKIFLQTIIYRLVFSFPGMINWLLQKHKIYI